MQNRVYQVHNGKVNILKNKNNIKPLQQKNIIGGSLLPMRNNLFEDSKVQRLSQNLQRVHLSKPRIPKKYISLVE